MNHSDASGKNQLLAHILPMLTFVLLLGLGDLVKTSDGSLWRAAPEFWVYPLQTLVCGTMLIFFWRDYNFQVLRRPFFVTAIALGVFVLWITPQQFLHFNARLVGFNPNALTAQPALYWLTLVLRFLRLVIVVPLVEEIFWRSFLLRYLISEKFDAVPFGAFSWLSFTVVAFAFAFSHSTADWPAALIGGALYNLVAYRTRSFVSCVAAHSLTNLALGLWITATGQWGFW
ncbi:MAG TPA: CAAX prenyl protease-related protein [Chthoniobacterales bacterium]